MKTTWLSCLLALACIAPAPKRAAADFSEMTSYTQGTAKLTQVGFNSAGDDCSNHESSGEPVSVLADAGGGEEIVESCTSPTRTVCDVVYERQEVTCYKTIC